MLTGLFILALGTAGGYLLRRWHRPTGFAPELVTTVLADGEWRLIASSDAPYRSISLRARYPITPLGLAEIVKAMRSGDYVAPPIRTADELRVRASAP